MNALMMRTIVLLSTVLVLFGAAESRAEELKSSLERNPIHAGESVRLVLELRRTAGGLKPDLSPLNNDFQVLQRATRTTSPRVSARVSQPLPTPAPRQWNWMRCSRFVRRG